MNQILTLIAAVLIFFVVKIHITIGYRTRPLWPFSCYALGFALMFIPRLIVMAYTYDFISPEKGLETINLVNNFILITYSLIFLTAGHGMIKVLRLNGSPLDMIEDKKDA